MPPIFFLDLSSLARAAGGGPALSGNATGCWLLPWFVITSEATDLLLLATGYWHLATGNCRGYFRFVLSPKSLAFALPSRLQPTQ
jgi:hypothetical protein